eukprot:gene10156-biopygen4330
MGRYSGGGDGSAGSQPLSPLASPCHSPTGARKKEPPKKKSRVDEVR